MVRLEPIQNEDIKRILEWNEGKSSDYLLQWAGPKYDFPLTYEQLENYILGEVQKENSNIFVYKIILIETGQVIGTIELRGLDKEDRVGRIGRFLIGDVNTRGKGLGTKSMKEILRIGFEELGFEKITLGVFDFNYSAIKCYEKAGFIKEKLHENYRKASNGYWSLYNMGISKEQWQKCIKYCKASSEFAK